MWLAGFSSLVAERCDGDGRRLAGVLVRHFAGLCLFGLLVCPSFLCEVCNLGESRWVLRCKCQHALSAWLAFAMPLVGGSRFFGLVVGRSSGSRS